MATIEEMKIEQERRNNSPAKIEERKAIRRAQRLSSGLNSAIRGGDADKIVHWQLLNLPFYNIPFSDWVKSRVPITKEETEILYNEYKRVNNISE